MRFTFDIAVAFVVAATTGVWSAWVAVDHAPLFNSLSAGPWVAWPRSVGVEADPYDLAAAARTGALPLGPGEGLTFIAQTDDQGRPLTGACVYAVDGETPPARLWTLTAYDDAGRLMTNAVQRSGFHSREVLRRPDGSFTISVAPQAEPGNWLPVTAGGRFFLTLRLYDTPLTSSARPTTIVMPAIRRTACP